MEILKKKNVYAKQYLLYKIFKKKGNKGRQRCLFYKRADIRQKSPFKDFDEFMNYVNKK